MWPVHGYFQGKKNVARQKFWSCVDFLRRIWVASASAPALIDVGAALGLLGGIHGGH
jgi:hypothetical protein